MTELAFIASAKRHRSLIETQHRLDRQRTDAAKLSEKAVLNSSRDSQLISKKIERDRQSLRDRLSTRLVNALAKQDLADQRHSKDVILGDIQFKNARKEIANELLSSRFEREAYEARLSRYLGSESALAGNLDEINQRNNDVQKSTIEWKARVNERRIAERDADILAKINLQQAIVRISEIKSGKLKPETPLLGQILDIRT